MNHLDLGCGYNPRNPYEAKNLYGVDIYPDVVELGPNFKLANLATEPIPFPDDFFDSISAFDVLEHIPRQAINFADGSTRLPFIALMNEIHRCLKPNGMLYAFTPAFPSAAAFQDPTHVNFITKDTHSYFCGEDAYGKRYGFSGEFEKVEVKWFYSTYARSAKRNWKITVKNWHKNHIKGSPSHLVWQLKAIK